MGIDFEIIEPLDKNSGNPYSDFLIQNGGKNGIHHIACKIHDRTVFIQKMEQMGIPPLTCGTMGAPMPNGEKKDFIFTIYAICLELLLRPEILLLVHWPIIPLQEIQKDMPETDDREDIDDIYG